MQCAMTEAQEQLLRDVQHAFHGNDKATAQLLIGEMETELHQIQKRIQMFTNEGVKQSATFAYRRRERHTDHCLKCGRIYTA